MSIKHFIVAALVSIVSFGGLGPAFATGSYYKGIDPASPRQTKSVSQKLNKDATGSINPRAVTYGFPVIVGQPRGSAPVNKGGEGGYYQGISRQ